MRDTINSLHPVKSRVVFLLNKYFIKMHKTSLGDLFLEFFLAYILRKIAKEIPKHGVRT